jgi:energy-converting hydrogenase Eha subunit C
MVTFDSIRAILKRRSIAALFVYSLLRYTIALCIPAASIVDVVIITPERCCISTTFLLCRFFSSETLTPV